MASNEEKGGIKSFVLQTVGGVVGLTIFSLLQVYLEFGWFLAAAYGLLTAFFLLGVLKPGESLKGRVTDVAFLAAVALQFWLKFFHDVSWLWSIVAGLGLLLVLAVLFAAKNYATTMAAQSGPTWAFGNLPPLELKASSGALSSPRLGSTLGVQINGLTFSLGEPGNADKLLQARFVPADSVSRVQAGARSDQQLLKAINCSVKSFGGEFVTATLPKHLKEKKIPMMLLDTTVLLYYGSRELERIAVVVAGDLNTMHRVTMSFSELAAEMYGEALSGSRGQRVWRAGGRFLVCEEESWKDLRRATFVWTSEELDVDGA